MPTTRAPKDTDSRKRQIVANVRLLPNEAEAVKELANRRQTTVAGVLRQALLSELDRNGVACGV